jgi:hypothetical protein
MHPLWLFLLVAWLVRRTDLTRLMTVIVMKAFLAGSVSPLLLIARAHDHRPIYDLLFLVRVYAHFIPPNLRGIFMLGAATFSEAVHSYLGRP